ncbi:MAG: TA system VapC family ribonuclease toxin [Burkholderiales bacterium]
MTTTGQRYLLDVNVWLALFDDQHVHNARTGAWLDQPRLRIATCPLTENGVLRIMNIPAFNRQSVAGFSAVRMMMTKVCDEIDHEFWPDDVSLRSDDVLDWGRVSGHNQVTDAYLLALAVKNGGALASFDQRIALSAVRGATEIHLALL